MFPFSNLRIQPDAVCGLKWECVCEKNEVDPGTLIIDLSPDETWATVGYDYGDETPGRHTLNIKIGGVVSEGQDPEAALILRVGHELGHVACQTLLRDVRCRWLTERQIGLFHEHVREAALAIRVS